MSKVFIITEQELNEFNSAKQLQVLDFILEESVSNPHYDVATLMVLAKQKVAEATGVWNYGQVGTNETSNIVESKEAEEALKVDSDFDSAQEELIAEEYLESDEDELVEETVNPVIDEQDFEEEELINEEEENLPANVTARRTMWKGLFSEANKLDKP